MAPGAAPSTLCTATRVSKSSEPATTKGGGAGRHSATISNPSSRRRPLNLDLSSPKPLQHADAWEPRVRCPCHPRDPREKPPAHQAWRTWVCFACTARSVSSQPNSASNQS